MVPFLKSSRIPSPIHRKPRSTSFVKKEPRTLGLNKNLEEFTLEIFVRGGERVKKNITRPTDERMLTNKFSQVRGIVT